MDRHELRRAYEATIRRYFDGCNEADVGKMEACFAPDAVHYFPDGAPQGPFVGAGAIAAGWADAVERLDSRWTIDRLLVDVDSAQAVIEWTHFKPRQGVYLRGDEWYAFDDHGLIAEIRAYYACPAAPEPRDHELGGYDYAERGYPVDAPMVHRSGR
jgi:ketosteroid isomerase-like protein